MKNRITCMAALFLLSGCTFLTDRLSSPGHDRLSAALSHLEKGNETAATKLLQDICTSGQSIEGVTDEALFRLSLLELREYDDAGKMQTIQKRLAQLQTEYPTSQWSRMSWPLTEYITRMETARAELRTSRQKNSALSKESRELNLTNQQLQGTIQNLTKENREFNQQIEQLKSLDLELEKKNRH